MSEKVTVRVSKLGEVEIFVSGMKGNRCLDATAGIERALGTLTSRKKTRNFYEGIQQQQESYEQE